MIRAFCMHLAAVVLCISSAAIGHTEQPPNSADGLTAQQGLQQLTTALGIGQLPPEPKQPEWFPLDPKLQDWTDQALALWEKRSSKIKTLECRFEQWEYDPQQIPKVVQELQAQGQLDTLPFTKYVAGVIKYSGPDKAMFRTNHLQHLRVASAADLPKYDSQPKENGDHWITDGERVITFNASRKEVLEWQLPPELQGKPLWGGRLAFLMSDLASLFQVNAKTMHEHYWIRPLHAEAPGEMCFELRPRHSAAANFRSLQIVLDEKEYLPIRVQLFHANYSPANPQRTAYAFTNRVINRPIDPREFSQVEIPTGWKHIKRPAN